MAPKSPPSPTLSQLPPVPSSPTYSYASTANPNLSQFNLPLPPPPKQAHAVLTKHDLEASQAAYADLLSSAKAFRLALTSLSTAASAFGSALESCARLKEARAEQIVSDPPNRGGSPVQGGQGQGGGPPPLLINNSFISAAQGTTKSTCTADTLLTVAGLQHLVANHQHILSETVYRSFEVPLLHELDKWRGAVEDEEESYASAVSVQSKEIRRLEKEGMKLHKQRRRDVAKFRSHLVELTTKLDGLTTLHGEHSRTLLRESQDTSARIVEASCSLVRAEVDIFESLARKGWTGGGLEDVLEQGQDLFASEDVIPDRTVGHSDGRFGGTGGNIVAGGAGDDGIASGGAGGGSKLFSILPPRSILADTTGGGREDTLRLSLAGAIHSPDNQSTIAYSPRTPPRDKDTESVFSSEGLNRPRGPRPFSPQPQPLALNPKSLFGASDPPSPTTGSRLNDEEEQDALFSPLGAQSLTLPLPGSHSNGNDGDDEDDEALVSPWRDQIPYRFHPPAEPDEEQQQQQQHQETIRPRSNQSSSKRSSYSGRLSISLGINRSLTSSSLQRLQHPSAASTSALPSEEHELRDGSWSYSGRPGSAGGMLSFVSASRMDVANGTSSNNDDHQYQSQDEYTIHGSSNEKNGDHHNDERERDQEGEENDITPTITPMTPPTQTATATATAS
ncbi:hypothetical protein QBC32DRAFT_46193 [Pseudoneurospora amorphoporcata]|uniref:IMD domain-containing protein n=1 Tax=Pseudoneurospora amorphoporcata TaxID=241081 RepID=A0AAN6NN42_9PEZI|nr:hypothetical protein QBC32DRAFT_46193 [Pseudoneurospora amorphoporcata]